MSNQTWQELVTTEVVAGAAIANSVTETVIFENISLPAYYMQVPRRLRYKASGSHSTTGTPTLIFRLRWGGVSGTVICLSPTFTCGSGVTNNMWQLEIEIQTRSNGSTGTLICTGTIIVNGATVPVQAWCVGGASAPAATTCNLTVATDLSLTAQWGTQSASNTLTGHNRSLESLN